MYETRLLSYNVPLAQVVPDPGSVVVPNIDMHSADFVAEIGEDWEPVSHALLPLGATMLVTILLRRAVAVPDVQAFDGA